MKCIICREEKAPSCEHIIPQALGNHDFTLNEVCKDCNSKLGSMVDCCLTDNLFVKIIRTGKYHEEGVEVFQRTVHSSDGETYRFTNNKPQKITKPEYGEDYIKLRSYENEDWTKTARKILERKDYSEEEIERMLQRSRIIEEEEEINIKYGLDIDLDRFNLAMIKIAYEYAYSIFGDEYLEDDVADLLRQLLLKGMESKQNIFTNDERKYITNFDKFCDSYLEIQNKYATQLTPPMKHFCVIHKDPNGCLLATILLFLEQLTSATICLSKNGDEFIKDNQVIGAYLDIDGKRYGF
ncbi:MAG: HNH endonuclease [Eubacteriales bacterium]